MEECLSFHKNATLFGDNFYASNLVLILVLLQFLSAHADSPADACADLDDAGTDGEAHGGYDQLIRLFVLLLMQVGTCTNYTKCNWCSYILVLILHQLVL